MCVRRAKKTPGIYNDSFVIIFMVFKDKTITETCSIDPQLGIMERITALPIHEYDSGPWDRNLAHFVP